jgi:hypothetical protein
MAWDRYVTPFSYGLWLAVAIAACAITVCLALTNYGHQKNQNLTLSAILFYVHACFCQKGQSDKSYLLPTIVTTCFGRAWPFSGHKLTLYTNEKKNMLHYRRNKHQTKTVVFLTNPTSFF